MVEVYRIWVLLSSVIGTFVGSRSDIKLLGLLLFFAIFFCIFFVVERIRILATLLERFHVDYKYYFLSITTLAVIGLIMFLVFTLPYYIPFLPYNNALYFNRGTFEFLLNPLHNHILKPAVALIFNFINLNISNSNYLSSLVFLDVFNSNLYLFILLSLLLTSVLAGLLTLKYGRGKSFLQKSVILVFNFIIIKNLIDGGLLWYEFITTTILLFLLYQKEGIVAKDDLAKLFITLTLIEYLITIFVVGPNSFYLQLVISVNLIYFSFYLLYFHKKRIGLLLFSVGFLLSLLSSYHLNKSLKPIFGVVNKDEKVLIRTEKDLDLPLYKDYMYFSDYLYSPGEKEDIFTILTKFDLFSKYGSLVTYDDCVQSNKRFKSYYLLVSDKEYSKNYFREDPHYTLELKPTSKSRNYYVVFEHRGICEFREEFTIANLIREYLDLDRFTIVRIG